MASNKKKLLKKVTKHFKQQEDLKNKFLEKQKEIDTISQLTGKTREEVSDAIREIENEKSKLMVLGWLFVMTGIVITLSVF